MRDILEVTSEELKVLLQSEQRRRTKSTPTHSSTMIPSTTMEATYRVHYSCEHKGRYIRNSKRRIRWVFGFANLLAIGEGKTGRACRGEEHDVELVWSIKSGKKRVFWNKSNISNLFRETNNPDVLEFTWKTRAGDTLQIIAHSSAVAGVDHQYDLFVNGASFFSLPGVCDVGKGGGESRSDESQMGRVRSHASLSENTSGDALECDLGSSSDFRLSMVGLKLDGDTDELRSELYSSSLDNVRTSVTSYLPQTEEMISRAIMDAFIVDDEIDNASSSSSIFVPHEEECGHLQVMAFRDAVDWARHNLGYAPRQDSQERALVYMQKQITSTLGLIRSDQISSQTAVRMLLGVAAILGLKFARPIPRDTVLIDTVSSGLTGGQLRDYLSSFGFVESFYIFGNSTQFGFCRFVDEEAPDALRQVIRERQLPPNVSFNIQIISESMQKDSYTRARASGTAVRSVTPVKDASPAMTPPLQGKRGNVVVTPEYMVEESGKECVYVAGIGSQCLVSPQSVSSMLDFSHFLVE